MSKDGFVYFLTNKSNTVIYVGVTSDLIKRIYEHKEKLGEGFTQRYNLIKLIYYESCGSIETVILREKQIKGWIRKKKVVLIESMNPKWCDLYERLL